MSQVLVDTSVWVDFFRSGASPASKALGNLMERGLICSNGLIRAEVLSGARSISDYRQLEESFSAIPILVDPSDLWDQAGFARWKMARKGIQVSIADLVVAVSASFHQKDLFTLDRAFRKVREVLPLNLIEI